MRKLSRAKPILLTAVLFVSCLSLAGERLACGDEHKTLKVLFIGNSYTGRHNLAKLVKAMAEAGDSALRFEVESVIYGGRRLVDHWRLGTQNYIKLATLTADEERATITSLEGMLAKNPKDNHAKSALGRHRELLESLESRRKKWDIVVLQSYRDDLEGDQSLYVEYAPKFAELIKAQGGRVVLYETTPTTQNAEPLAGPPDRTPVIRKAHTMAALSRRIDATAVPMSLVALRCQTVRPDLTLRFVNDAHLNQTLAYLTACTFYAALFDRSPEGLPIDTVTDIRYFDDDHKDQDRDGGPISRTFSAKDRADLQRIAWEGFREFREIAAEQPNIVLILADDMGYGDLGGYGHPIAKTPHIDRLAKQGARFTQHYANGPECSPTRTALLTGRYQQRAGGLECAIGTGNVGRYDDAIRLAQQHELGLPVEQTVFPGAMKEAGYACGVFGKWHLGYEPKFNPLEHGWDEFFGYLGGNVHYFNHRELSDLPVLFRGRSPVDREGYMTHLITDDSISFIERHKEQPFFLYVSHECPHFPFQGPSDQNKVVTKENWTERNAEAYVAMLEDLDTEVGRILSAIATAGITEKTLVVFVSDNGGFEGVANMGPLRGAKSTTLEGGIRVPLIIRWPNRIESNTTSEQVSATFDLTKSFLQLAKADVPVERLDGYDIVSHLVERRDDFPRTLFWRGRRGDLTWSAVRDGDLKYVRKTEEDTTEEWLFNLSSDIGEANDLRATQAPETSRLRNRLREWEDEVIASR